MPSATVGQLDTRVLNRLDNNSLLYVQEDRYVYYNEAQRFLNLITGLLPKSLFPLPAEPFPGGSGTIPRHRS